MPQQTSTKQRDILNTQNNAEETHNVDYSKKIVTREPIDNTPFWVVGNEEQGYSIVMGKYRLTETAITPEKAIEKLETEKWKIITTVITTIITIMDNTASQLNDTNKKSTL